MAELDLKDNDLASYSIFFSDQDITFLQAVAGNKSITNIAEEYNVPLNDVRSRKEIPVERFNRIVSRCQHPVGARNRPLAAPIEILQLPLEVEAEFLRPGNSQGQLIEVKDLYQKQITQEILLNRYMTVTEGVVGQINASLQRNEIGLPPVAKTSVDTPIYIFFQKEGKLLQDRQKEFLQDVWWGNLTRQEVAQEYGIPPTRVTYGYLRDRTCLNLAWMRVLNIHMCTSPSGTLLRVVGLLLYRLNLPS